MWRFGSCIWVTSPCEELCASPSALGLKPVSNNNLHEFQKFVHGEMDYRACFSNKVFESLAKKCVGYGVLCPAQTSRLPFHAKRAGTAVATTTKW